MNLKNLFVTMLALVAFVSSTLAQNSANKSTAAITSLIDKYSLSRETKDSTLLKSILTDDIDQLVSSGEWRMGKGVAISGMMKSSTANPGSRKITIDKIKFLHAATAIVDARYDIQNEDGSMRRMWSTFIVVQDNQNWRISAIRNMLPAGT